MATSQSVAPLSVAVASSAPLHPGSHCWATTALCAHTRTGHPPFRLGQSGRRPWRARKVLYLQPPNRTQTIMVDKWH
jgi:hypothetical protein